VSNLVLFPPTTNLRLRRVKPRGQFVGFARGRSGGAFSSAQEIVIDVLEFVKRLVNSFLLQQIVMRGPVCTALP
jgi:hypothetical protein